MFLWYLGFPSSACFCFALQLSPLPAQTASFVDDGAGLRDAFLPARLDEMLSGKGYYRGSTILVSGTAGTGKTSLGAHFLDAACRRGERCLCFLFEESPQQLLRNMRSIGIDLEPWVTAGLLQFHADRPSRYGPRDASGRRCTSVVADFASGDRHRPGHEPDDGGHLRRRPGDADTHHRSLEDREHHGDAGEPRTRIERDRAGGDAPSRR